MHGGRRWFGGLRRRLPHPWPPDRALVFPAAAAALLLLTIAAVLLATQGPGLGSGIELLAHGRNQAGEDAAGAGAGEPTGGGDPGAAGAQYSPASPSPETPHPLVPGPRGAPLLCAPPEDLYYQASPWFGVAADSLGHFTFYGIPDASTGEPTDHSYLMLTDCSEPTLFSYPNYLSLSVTDAAGRTELLTAQDASSAQTRRLSDGALETSLKFPDGVFVVQDLRLTTPPGATRPAGALDISYLVGNSSPQEKSVSLRSVLTPAGGGLADDRFSLSDSSELRTERSLTGGAVSPFTAPRPGATADSSGYWSPGPLAAPDEITFADPPRFLGSFIPDPAPGQPFSTTPGFAVYWLARSLAPGASLPFSHRYGTPPRGD